MKKFSFSFLCFFSLLLEPNASQGSGSASVSVTAPAAMRSIEERRMARDAGVNKYPSNTRDLARWLKEDMPLLRASVEEAAFALTTYKEGTRCQSPVKILVMGETLSEDHPNLSPLKIETSTVPTIGSEDHGPSVVGIAQQVIGKRNCQLAVASGTVVTLESLQGVSVINASYTLTGTSWENSGTWIRLAETLNKALPKPLFIQALGNTGKPLEIGQCSVISHAYPLRILAINLNRNFEVYPESTTPGSYIPTQEDSIAALGTEVYSHGDAEGYSTLTGTSMAAPFISGVAAILISEHSDLDLSIIREAILWSTWRTFFVPSIHNDYGTVIYDPAETPLESFKNTSDPKITFKRFDPEHYGRGILSLRNAREYLEIYKEEQNTGELTTPARRREKLLGRIHAIEVAAANKIGLAYKEYRKKVTTSPVETPLLKTKHPLANSRVNLALAPAHLRAELTSDDTRTWSAQRLATLSSLEEWMIVLPKNLKGLNLFLSFGPETLGDPASIDLIMKTITDNLPRNLEFLTLGPFFNHATTEQMARLLEASPHLEALTLDKYVLKDLNPEFFNSLPLTLEEIELRGMFTENQDVKFIDDALSLIFRRLSNIKNVYLRNFDLKNISLKNIFFENLNLELLVLANTKITTPALIDFINHAPSSFKSLSLSIKNFTTEEQAQIREAWDAHYANHEGKNRLSFM